MENLDALTLAHYDKKTNKYQLLDEHSIQTSLLVRESLSAAVQFDLLNHQQLRTIGQAIGKFHDFGKFTDFFQEYLKYDKSHGHLKNHAHISALVLYRYLQHLNPFSCSAREQEVLLFLIYLVVRLHHGNLTTSGLFLESDMNPLRLALVKQTNQLMRKAEDITSLYELETAVFPRLLDVIPVLDSKALTQMPLRLKSRNKHERWYFLLVYLFSLLVDSDKLDSAKLGKKQLGHIPPECVLHYLEEKHGDHNNNRNRASVTDRREKARQTIVASVETLTDDQLRNCRLFTLTAPTGIGKTLSSLQAALVLRERLKPLTGNYPRIITAIPFINILQGTEADYRATFGDLSNMVVHHQHADFMTSNGSDDDMPLDKKLLEVEAWEGDIVLTTFVQLFQSLFTGNNRRLKKLNKLAGSIVILDEVQSIPEKYKPLIGACLIKLGEYYGTRFILMTATQPKIIDLGKRLLRESRFAMPDENFLQSVELLPDFPDYFQTLERTRVIPVLDKTMDIPGFVDFFLATWEQKSSVIVVNTIKQSLDLFEKLTDLELEDTEIRYLSTNLMPIHRKETIREVRRMLEEGQRVILVSTQTIEAGVDLDFDAGYRALAPLDAIVQTAGRVNRKGEKMDAGGRSKVCPVYVFELGTAHNYVYDLPDLMKTKHFLLAYEGKHIEEREYQTLINLYYNDLFRHPLDEASTTIWSEGIMKLDFEEIEKFQLIKQVGDIADVFIEWDQDAVRLADAYCELRQNKVHYNLHVLKGIMTDDEINKLDPELSLFQRKALLKAITARMGNYMVQLRIKRLVRNKPLLFENRMPVGVEAPFYYVPNEEVSLFYKRETGYLDESGEAYVI